MIWIRIIVALTALASLGASIYMALQGVKGWGWFLFAAMVIADRAVHLATHFSIK